MGLRSVDAAGNGQAAPVDVQREKAIDPLQVPPVEIPRTPVERLAEQRPAQQANQWSAQERIQRGRGSLWEKGDLGKWSTFERGKSRDDQPTDVSRASVTIDQDRQTGGRRPKLSVQDALSAQQRATMQLRKNAEGSQDTPAWRTMRQFHLQAASFEERAKDALQPFMGAAPKRSGRHRRRVLLED